MVAEMIRPNVFLAWKYQLGNDNSPKLIIDLLVLSHADGDHLRGLIPILEHDKIEVKQIVHNGIGMFDDMDEKSGNLSSDGDYLETYHSSLDQLSGFNLRGTFKKWIDLVDKLNIPYSAVSSETGELDLGDPTVRLEILGPIVSENEQGEHRLKWFGKHSHTINGHSVLFRLVHDDIKILFSGDINIEGGRHMLEHPNISSKLKAHVFKTPHHGSHEFHTPFLEAIRPQISVISSGDSPDHGHPRANFIGAIGLASRSSIPLVFSTEIASTFVDAKEVDLRNVLPADSLRDEDLENARLFKKKLHGMINVRSDGKYLYAMRRVNASYQWESYGPLIAEAYPTLF